MTYKETLFFVGQSLTINHSTENKIAIEQQLKENSIDWDAVVKVSTGHFVFPALYCNLKRANFLHYLPEDLVNYMVHITDLNRERNQKIIAQAKEINELLLANNITPIFLKGTGNLLEGLYEDIAERMVGDIDFIVEEKNIKTTVSLLKSYDYYCNDSIVKEDHWHYPAFIHKDKEAYVEIHRKILKDNFQFHLGIDLFKDVNNIKSNICVLSFENKLFATILPKIINDNLYEKRIIILRNAYDVYLLSHQNILNQTEVNYKNKHQKLNNYLGCMKIIFKNTPFINIVNNQSYKRYTGSYIKLLDNNKLENWKVKFINTLVINKNRFYILKKAFKHKSYRKFVVARILQLSFYKKNH